MTVDSGASFPRTNIVVGNVDFIRHVLGYNDRVLNIVFKHVIYDIDDARGPGADTHVGSPTGVLASFKTDGVEITVEVAAFDGQVFRVVYAHAAVAVKPCIVEDRIFNQDVLVYGFLAPYSQIQHALGGING